VVVVASITQRKFEVAEGLTGVGRGLSIRDDETSASSPRISPTTRLSRATIHKTQLKTGNNCFLGGGVTRRRGACEQSAPYSP